MGFKNVPLFLIIIAFFSTTLEPLKAQKENLETIISSFTEYNSLYRETVYCHLNKSTFVKGEMIGFSAYVFDKELKVPSKLTKNLYCVITDKNNKIVKSKMVKVDHGFANNIFTIDSLFTSGNYTFKAYTNWMNNFDEPNAFFESFRVIDPEVENTVKKTVLENTLDVQFLPEGGNLVDLVKTNVGVIVKNSQGFGVSDIEGSLYDLDNNFITTFKTNTLGISRFLLYPQIGQKYVAKINYLNTSFDFYIDAIEPQGISIQINNSKNNLVVELKTNQSTLNTIKGKTFNLTIHNGKEVKGVPVTFKDKDVVKMIDHKELFSGINIFTLFDETNKPVLERLFFNHDGINLMNSGNAVLTRLKDSIQVSLPLLNFANSSREYSNISIVVLPEETTSYQRHQNIISQTYLQPYVNGYVENAQYYFTKVDSKKKYDLDNLLITQGWSSYKWQAVFNNNVTDSFVFEDGIVLKANKNNNNDESDFVLYPLKLNNGLVLNVPEDKNSFIVSNLYPQGDEKLGIGVLGKKGEAKKANLYAQFFPSRIPNNNNQSKPLYTNQLTVNDMVSESQFLPLQLKTTQVLDEVFIERSAKETRIEILKGDPFSTVDVFDDVKRRMNLTFAQYVDLFIPEFVAYESRGTLTIFNRVSTSLRDTIQVPAVFLDDVYMPSLEIFYGFDMSIVDYITVNRRGAGEGFIGTNGVIRVYTSLDFIKNRNRESLNKFEFPLTFSESKKFYVPKYNMYNNQFFKEYGVIGWIPKGEIDTRGHLNFTVYNPKGSGIKLFIEGVTDQGKYISEIKVLNSNNYD